jgi:hypothetical protein
MPEQLKQKKPSAPGCTFLLNPATVNRTNSTLIMTSLYEVGFTNGKTDAPPALSPRPIAESMTQRTESTTAATHKR